MTVQRGRIARNHGPDGDGPWCTMVSMRGLITEGRMTTFTKDMSILEALQADPRAREVFAIHGLACIGCMGAMMESIEDGARMHGIDPVALLRDLNRLPPLTDSDG